MYKAYQIGPLSQNIGPLSNRRACVICWIQIVPINLLENEQNAQLPQILELVPASLI